MTPELARKVRELVDAGAKIIGPKPVRSPSLQNYPKCDAEVREIADALWDNHRVICGKTFEEIAAADDLPADFAFSSPAAEATLRYIHRHLPDADLYFVANGADTAVQVDATFRIAGRRPEIWDPQTGEISMPAVFEDLGNRVRVPMHLNRLQSVFVVFRAPLPSSGIVQVSAQPATPIAKCTDPPIVLTQDASGRVTAQIFCNGRFELKESAGGTQALEVADVPPLRALTGPWQLRFPAGWDAPEQIELDRLISWSEHDDPGIKYFSGTATYTKSFQGPPESELAGSRWFLDLGDVQVISQVTLNGHDLGTCWKPPFRIDVTEALTSGQNELVIQVTNLWANRLIGDEQFPDDAQWEGPYLAAWPDWFLQGTPRPEPRRKTFAVVKHYNKDSPLLPSGLLGPVTLKAARVVSVPPAS